jgi:hypothetical protein
MRTVQQFVRAFGFFLVMLNAAGAALAQGNLNYQNGFDDGHGLGVYQGAVDLDIRAEQPAVQFHDAPFIWVDGPPPTKQILIRFDGIVGTDPGQIAPDAYIAAAELVLVVSDATNAQSANSHQLHEVFQGWDASTLTWQSNPPFGGDGVDADGTDASVVSLATIPATMTNQTIRLDVRDAVAHWSAGAANYGLVMLPGGTDGLAIRTSEDPVIANRPRLEVTAGAADCFADAVEDFAPILVAPGQPDPLVLDPEQTLGAPDSAGHPCQIPGSTPCRNAALGLGGSITLRFVDNVLTGSGGPEMDLWVFEIGPDVEDTFVEISSDGSTWQPVGKVFGSTSAIDIDAFGFGPESNFEFVRLTDDPNEGNQTGVTVGADIDAICALSSVSVSQVPSMQPLGLAGLALFVLITTLSVLRQKTGPTQA